MRRWAAGCLACIVIGLPALAWAQVLDALVARVDLEVVTWSRVLQERELQRLGGAPAEQLTPEAVRETLVRRRLFVAEARKLRLEVSADEAQDELTALETAVGTAVFRETISRLGLQRSGLEERAAQLVLVRRYRNLRREMTFVPEAEVRAAFLQRADALPPGTSLAEAHDTLRAQLAEQKFQEEAERWFRQQVVEGRVQWLPLPAAPTP